MQKKLKKIRITRPYTIGHFGPRTRIFAFVTTVLRFVLNTKLYLMHFKNKLGKMKGYCFKLKNNTERLKKMQK